MDQTAAQPRSLTRLSSILLLVSVSLFASGCGIFGTHKKVQVPQLLTPLAEADTARLISEVNRLAARLTADARAQGIGGSDLNSKLGDIDDYLTEQHQRLAEAAG